MIGIILADKHEINKFDFESKGIKKINQFEFSNFIINNKEVVVVHSGIGLANAAAATQELISSFKVEKIINYGAVGASEELNVYDIVTPKHIYYHDITTPWYKRGQTPDEKEYYLNNISSDKNNNLASGGSFLASKESIEDVKNDLDVSIFDMETAAIAQIADKNNIPLDVIKCVSDIVGVDSSKNEDINLRITNAGKKAFEYMLKQI